jgi:hypothetical protein
METDNIDELYIWINKRYEDFTDGFISEEDYLKDLEHYKKKLALAETTYPEKTVEKREDPDSIAPSQVRSTSIAGLRKKLLEEMRK